MDYTKFLQSRNETLRLPYFAGNTVCDDTRIYRLRSAPASAGWYAFAKSGRYLDVQNPIEPECELWHLYTHRGYVAQHQLVSNDHQSRLFGVDGGIQRFSPVTAAAWFDGHLWFTGEEFESEVAMLVRDAFEEEQSIDAIKGVTPALAQAFLIESAQRQLLREAEIRAEEKAARAEHGRQVAAWRRTIEGRIALALSHSGAALVDWLDRGQNHAIVRYRLGARKFECVIDKASLQIVDSGICLDGADRELNLSSLPSAVQEAIDTGQLHVYRRA